MRTIRQINMLHVRILCNFETQIFVDARKPAEYDGVQLAVAGHKWKQLRINKKTIADVEMLQLQQAIHVNKATVIYLQQSVMGTVRK